jgi:hypothetical protein
VWVLATSKKTYDKVDFGWYGGGWFHDCPDGVNLGIRDTLNIRGVPGQAGAGSFVANMNPTVIRDAATKSKANFDVAVAATICHELGLHAMGGKSGHHVTKGFVDASHGGQIGANFSAKACQLIVDRLDVEPGD